MFGIEETRRIGLSIGNQTQPAAEYATMKKSNVIDLLNREEKATHGRVDPARVPVS